MYSGRNDAESRLEKVGAFVQWLDSNHVDHNSVKLAKTSEGVGLGLQAAHMIQVYLYFLDFLKKSVSCVAR